MLLLPQASLGHASAHCHCKPYIFFGQSIKASIRATGTRSQFVVEAMKVSNYLSFCKTDLDNQQCANTHEDNVASHKDIIYICQHHVLFTPVLCQIWKGQQSLPILVLVKLMVCLQNCGEYTVYNDTQLTCKELRKHADMLVKSRLTPSSPLCLLLGSAQLAMPLHATARSALS